MKPQDERSLLQYMMQVNRRMAEIRSLPPLLSYMIDEVLKLVGAERGFVVLTQDDGTLDFRVKRDKDGNDLAEGEDTISQSILTKVVTSNEAVVVEDAMTDHEFGQALSVMHLRLRSVMCAPLKTQKRTIGAIYVENRSARGIFEEEDLPPLELFAYQAAVAIENASLNDNIARANIQLESANEQLRKLDKMKSDFILLVSHELRTPLTAIKAYAQLLKVVGQTDMARGKVLEVQDNLERTINRMQKMIGEIVHVFRLSSGQLELVLQRTDIELPIMNIVSSLANICSQRNLNLTIENLSDLPHVIVDDEQIEVIFSNVLGNAIKYTPDGGQITVKGHEVDNGIEIIIEDSGIGVPIEEQEKVFDLFYVLNNINHHSTGKHKFRGGGLGLGLPIAKGIVEAHHGTISLQSPGFDEEKLPGTTCRVFLPLES